MLMPLCFENLRLCHIPKTDLFKKRQISVKEQFNTLVKKIISRNSGVTTLASQHLSEALIILKIEK